MNNPEPKQPGDQPFDPKKAARRAHLAFQVAADFTLPLRRSGGGRSKPGTSGAIAFLILGFWSFMTLDLACLYLWFLWTAALVPYALSTDRTAYSHFEGEPFLTLLVGDHRLASILEPFVLLAIGCWLYPRHPCLAVVILASGLGCAAGEITEWHQRRRIVIEYGDGQHELEFQRALYQRSLNRRRK